MVRRRGYGGQATLLRHLDAECASAQPKRHGRADWLAVVQLSEWSEIISRVGHSAVEEVLDAVAHLIEAQVPHGDRVIHTDAGEIVLVIHDRTEAQLGRLFAALSKTVVNQHFMAGDEPVRVTLAIGFSAFGGSVWSATALRCARMAAAYSMDHLDLQPRAFSDVANTRPRRWQELLTGLEIRRGARFSVQLMMALAIAVVLPFVIYMSLPDRIAMPLSQTMFVITLIVLIFTSTMINIEGILSLSPAKPPDQPARPYPPATAIVAAYLPNEAATVGATIEHLLELDYPAPLQIVLAYNTPHDFPIEETLRELASRHSNFVPLRVEGSLSKAQNVNAALSIATGEFTAIFDADHRPAPDSFQRAWRWLSDGADVVQGHCVIRNGATNWLTRLVAVEFEQIYAAAHPGSARLRGFAIFGGSNGYWKTSLLRSIRMRREMLTEDIDSTMRAVAEGHRFVSDPGLISTELAPATLRSLSHQRLRWAQGWLQVSLRHTWLMLKSPNLDSGQKLGMLYMLPWRDMFPWMSLQIFPVLAFWIVREGSVFGLNWFVPVLVAATIYVLITGPLQSLIAYVNAAPQLRRHSWWFAIHSLLSYFYGEFLTMLSRVAHLRQVMGENEWRVTPRVHTGTTTIRRL